MDEEELLPRAGYDMKEEEEEIRRRRQEEESAMWIRGTPIESSVLFVKNNLVRFESATTFSFFFYRFQYIRINFTVTKCFLVYLCVLVC